MGRILTVSSDAYLNEVKDLIPSDYVAVAIRGERPYNEGAALIEELRDYFLQEPYDEMTNDKILERFDFLKEKNRRRISMSYGMLMAEIIGMNLAGDDINGLDNLN